jgi:hypothetical protein
MPHLTQFFRILLTASFLFFSLKAFAADEIKILAKVNQNVITNYDVENRMQFLEITTPEMKKATSDEKKYYAMQSLIQDELRLEYAKRVNFKLDKEQKIRYRKIISDELKKKKIKNIAFVMEKNSNFIESEALWRAVIELIIRPKIQISQEMVDEVAKKEKKLSKEKIADIIVEQQIHGQSAQILESIRKISIIEFTQEQ